MKQQDLFDDAPPESKIATHYNTTRESGAELEKYRLQCGRQQRAVLDWFRAHPDVEATPFEVGERVLPNAPITSVRRAMTNLTDAGYLEKTDKKRRERYARNNYLWKLAEQPE